MFANPNQQNYGNNNYQQGGYPQQQQRPPQQPAASTDLPSFDDLLAQNGAKSFFNIDSKIGDTVTGRIEVLETTQVRDFNSQLPKYWNDGKPVMQFHIILQTGLNDPTVEDDDGRRSIYIKSYGIQKQALLTACRNAGVKHPKVGDTFTATFSGYGERGNAPQPPKAYEYQIQPASNVDALLNGSSQQAPQAQQPIQQQAGQYPPQQVQPMPQTQPAPSYQQPAMGYPQSQQQGQQNSPAPIQQAPQFQQPVQQQAVNQQQILQLHALGKGGDEIAGLLGLDASVVNTIIAQNPTVDDGGVSGF